MSPEHSPTRARAAASGPRQPDAPLVVLVGRPNVGKSTLFNRLTRTRQALVADVPGTTRDRREGWVDDGRYRFRLVDTGGMGFGMELGFSGAVEAQIAQAAEVADAVWVVLDGRSGLNPYDGELVRWVERLGKPFQVVVNKMDSPGRRANLVEFYALGTERLRATSAAHGVGLDELLEATARDVPALLAVEAVEAAGEAAVEEPLRVAFMGRPNVGKSSLLNRVLGQARMIVADQAGTTREAVEVPFRFQGQDYVLVDTAGIRRRARTHEVVEKLGVLHSLGALRWVQVAVLVVDASEPLAVQDARLADTIVAQRRAVVVAMNKWDRIGGGARRAKAVEAEVRGRLRFLDFAAFVPTSALDGTGVERVFREVQRAAGQFRREIQTADLNRMVQAASLRSPPPALAGSPTRIYYGAQVGTEPPAFRFFTNHPGRIDEAYTRFFENQLRHHFGLQGTPLRIEWRGRRGERRERTAGGGARPGRTGRAGKASAAKGSGPKSPSGRGGKATDAGRRKRTRPRGAGSARPAPKGRGRRRGGA